MTPQQERLTQVAQFHNKADAIKIGTQVMRRLFKSKGWPFKSAYAKFCRRMARNNERAYERNSH